MLLLKFKMLKALADLPRLPAAFQEYLKHAMDPEKWSMAPHALMGAQAPEVFELAQLVRRFMTGENDRILQAAVNNSQKDRVIGGQCRKAKSFCIPLQESHPELLNLTKGPIDKFKMSTMPSPLATAEPPSAEAPDANAEPELAADTDGEPVVESLSESTAQRKFLEAAAKAGLTPPPDMLATFFRAR